MWLDSHKLYGTCGNNGENSNNPKDYQTINFYILIISNHICVWVVNLIMKTKRSTTKLVDVKDVLKDSTIAKEAPHVNMEAVKTGSQRFENPYLKTSFPSGFQAQLLKTSSMKYC